MDTNCQLPVDLGDLKASVEVEEVSKGEASNKQHHMAFTIHFADATNGAPKRNVLDKVRNYGLKHRQNQSVPSTEETKATKAEVNSALAVSLSPVPGRKVATKAEVNSALAVSLSPVPGRKVIAARRAGYHSEGYFSSDQEEELRSRSGFFVKKLKNIEKGMRRTNLAQEKKNMAEHTSQAKLNNSPHLGRHEFGDFHVEEPSLKIRLNDFEGYPSKTINNVQTPEHCLSKDEWLAAATSNDDIEANTFDNVLHIDDGDNDLINDAASETGTYTIDKDELCLEEEQARKKIAEVIISSTVVPDDASEDYNYNMSSYRNGSNWINDWATQVAQHNNQIPAVTGLPPLPIDKHAGHGTTQKASSSTTTHIPSPLQSPGGTLRRSHPRGPLSPPSRHSPVLPVEQHIEETQSFLRATESVVTAMQARMSLSLDSGGESDADTNHSYQQVTRGGSIGNRQELLRRSSGVSEGSPRRAVTRVTQSEDSGSEASEVKTKKPEPPPQMKYNRAFSLRRARLESEPESSPPSDRKKILDALPASVAKLKKNLDPAKPNTSTPLPPKISGPNSPKTKTLSRTDCGRFSVRAPKNSPQPTPPPPVKSAAVLKKGSKKPGGRSNSTLSSKEVEFQNWKRRKSYDPMKAAAEGKKKDAAKKAIFSTSMTQSTTTVEELSESHPVLRSASFHGTAGLTPTYISSEEDDSPTSEFPPHLDTVVGSPVKLSGEGAHGGSRASLHSNASNSSLRGRTKLEALDSLVVAALCGLSNKLRASSCIVLKKLRYLYEEDFDKTEQLSAIIDLLESPTQPDSPQSRSPSREISGTLKNLKQIESVIKVLDDILFDDEEFDEIEGDTLQ